MHAIAYILGAVAFVALAGLAIALMLSSSSNSERKRKEDLQSRRIAHQPWDAQSSDGRGNR